MVKVQPFTGSIVKPEHVGQVGSPAYDALTPNQRRQYRTDHPLSYLHVTRASDDESDGAAIDNRTLAHRGRASLEQLLAAQVFSALERPAYVVYELESDGHVQRGLVCEIGAQHFADHAIPHEATQPRRAALLAEHFGVVGAASSPVACSTGFGGQLPNAVEALGVPTLEHQTVDGLIQRVWVIDEPARANAIEKALLDHDLYIIDGHHRAAANRHLLEHGHPRPVLAVIFAPESLHLAGFHRLVRLPPRLGFDRLIQLVGKRFATRSLASVALPEPGHVTIGFADRWFDVTFDERPVAGSALVRLGSLDPSVVERELIKGIVGRFTDRFDVTYMPDEASPLEIAEQATAEDRVTILVAPVDLHDVFAVADGGMIMPAKSTYFVPKVRSGIFLHLSDPVHHSAQGLDP